MLRRAAEPPGKRAPLRQGLTKLMIIPIKKFTRASFLNY